MDIADIVERPGSFPARLEASAVAGHRSHAMVELYRRENAPLIDNAVTTLGLC